MDANAAVVPRSFPRAARLKVELAIANAKSAEKSWEDCNDFDIKSITNVAKQSKLGLTTTSRSTPSAANGESSSNDGSGSGGRWSRPRSCGES